MQFKITTKGDREVRAHFDRMTKQMLPHLERAVETVSNDAKVKMYHEAPKGTGDLKQSIKKEVKKILGGVRGKIWPDVDYAKYVEEGRGPGGLPPIDSGSHLHRWLQAKGIPLNKAFVIARSIAQKGTEPNKFITRTFNAIKGDLQKEVERQLKKLIN